MLILSGSGPLDRDSNMKGQALNVGNALADALAAHGIASLRYDKRGVGESGGEYLTAGFEQETDDARAALEALPDERAVVGHSVGATIAIRLAAEYELAGVVLLCAGLAPGTEVMREQSERIAQTVPRLGRRFFLGRQAAARRKLLDSTGDVVRVGTGKLPARWFREYMAYDPEPDLRAIQCPVLAITGTSDLQVDPPASGASESSSARRLPARARTASPTCCGPARTRRACARIRSSSRPRSTRRCSSAWPRGSALDRPAGEPADDLPLGEDEEDQRGHHRQRRESEDARGVRVYCGREFVDAQRQRHVRRR